MTKPKPARPLPSATLILVRDGSDGLEILMVVRNKKSDFASGALVFPGGKVDKADNSAKVRFYCDGSEALNDTKLGMHVAAIRETFEECGVLLARHNGSSNIISGDHLKRLEPYRKRLNSGELTMGDFLEKENLTLACDLLTAFAHWITPEPMVMRFDTCFYLAPAPNDQYGIPDGSESVALFWITPQKALEEADNGNLSMMFPTRMNILRIGKSKTFKGAVDAAKASKIITVMPVLEKKESGYVLCIPREANYGITEAPLDLSMVKIR